MLSSCISHTPKSMPPHGDALPDQSLNPDSAFNFWTVFFRPWMVQIPCYAYRMCCSFELNIFNYVLFNMCNVLLYQFTHCYNTSFIHAFLINAKVITLQCCLYWTIDRTNWWSFKWCYSCLVYINFLWRNNVFYCSWPRLDEPLCITTEWRFPPTKISTSRNYTRPGGWIGKGFPWRLSDANKNKKVKEQKNRPCL